MKPRIVRPDAERRGRANERGATAVELALVLGLFITLMLGVVDITRWALMAQGLQESARLGARLAAVCDPHDPVVKQRVRERIASWTGSPGRSPLEMAEPALEVEYAPAGCTAATCTSVRFTLSGAALPGVAPWWGGDLPLPTAWIEIPREGLSSRVDGRSNPACR